MNSLVRSLRSMVSAALVIGLATIAGSTVATTVSASTPVACSALKMTGQTSIASRPGGTTVRVVLTNHRYPSCTWSNLTGFQFLTATGSGAGPVRRVLHTSAAGSSRSVNDTFQVVDNVVTMSGVHCTAKVASFLQVITPDRTSLKIALKRAVGVCVGGKTKWTTVHPPSFPVAALCTSASIRLSFAPANGAAGTIYLPLRFTNVSSSPCSISGIPEVQTLSGRTRNAAHATVGPAARKLNLSASGPGTAIRLMPGETASAAYGVTETGNYTPSRCLAKTVQSLRVRFKSGANWWQPASFLVCTRLASTSISGVVPSSDGLAPLS
ncbi:MAG: DUF4232 domain-containing protein [Acidimicrobiaceae bacterium]|nr:DUF4232 domain-containing protein [Acidimicrobiaceae bacterium]